MGDISELGSSGSTKIAGADSDGNEQGWIESAIKTTGERALHVIAEVPEALANENVRVRTDFSVIPLEAVTGNFVLIHEYTGTGVFLGFNVEFNQDAVQIQLKIDGQDIFYTNGNNWVNLAELKTFGNKEALVDTIDFSSGLDFSPKYPIRFNSSFVLCARSDNNQTNKSKERLIIQIVENT